MTDTNSEASALRAALEQERAGRVFAEVAAVDHAVAAAKAEGDHLEAELTNAFNEGRTADLARLQRRVAENATKLTAAEARRAWLGDQQQRAAAAPPADPFEQFVGSWDQRVQGWIRSHPRFYSDQVYRQHVMSAANLAGAKGLVPGSDEYARFVEAQAAETMDELSGETTRSEGRQEHGMMSVDTASTAGGRRHAPEPEGMRERAEAAHRANPPRDRRPTLSPEEAQTALALAKSLELTGADGKPLGEADTYRWYFDKYNSPSAKQRRLQWYGAA